VRANEFRQAVIKSNLSKSVADNENVHRLYSFFGNKTNGVSRREISVRSFCRTAISKAWNVHINVLVHRKLPKQCRKKCRLNVTH